MHNRTFMHNLPVALLIFYAGLFGCSACKNQNSQTLHDRTQKADTAANILKEVVQPDTMVKYLNTEYGFTFSLPGSWKGYTIIKGTWQGIENTAKVEGPKLFIRHPLWTNQIVRQDIPIMIFTPVQWGQVQEEILRVSAAPIPPEELGHNAKYIFALPPRYNFAYPDGFEEVEEILKGHPLKGY